MYRSYRHTNREDYYRQFIFPKKPEVLLQWQNKDSGKDKVVETVSPIIFRNIPFGCSYDGMIDLAGKPRFVVNNPSEIKSYQIAFYKERLNGNKVISQCHFINKRFIYGCYIFRHSNREKFSLIRDILYKKYAAENAAVPLCDKIIDGKGNRISCLEDVYFYVTYLAGEDHFVKLIKDFLDSEKQYQSGKLKTEYSELYRAL